jgi:hypothetical protein
MVLGLIVNSLYFQMIHCLNYKIDWYLLNTVTINKVVIAYAIL